MARLFGTDGVRGVAGRELTADLALRLGRAAVAALAAGGQGGPTMVVGRDTRASGEMLEAAFSAGVSSAGGRVLAAGVITTPAVARLTIDLGADAGVVISASHNPPEYNGIKFFGKGGFKLPDEVEAEIEELVPSDGPVFEGVSVGRIEAIPDSVERYLAHLTRAAEGSLGGMRLVVDCANGAASGIAPEAYRRLGADVVALHDDPDGTNINIGCGATHPEVVAEAVLRFHADAGVAHDGDADRAMFADSGGNVVDGDQVLAACAIALAEQGRLAGNAVVSTVMANLGFHQAMREAGLEVVVARVGDRYVLEEMERRGAVLGGEQSGHIIFREHATTGDGILTAIRFLCLAAARGESVESLAARMHRYPQVLENVEVRDRDALEGTAEIWDAVREAEAALGERGRVLVRASGTEPLVRVMVEAETEEDARRHASSVADVARRLLA
ncbi:MAG: phosphoglucosamine mutase [Actinobacteria bacterium]|nr:phosphoglucosamine mutase [Actinomycetota bacterium]